MLKISEISQAATMNQASVLGQRLARMPYEDGGWAEYFDEGAGLGIEDPYMLGVTSILMENTKNWMAGHLSGTKRNSKGLLQINETVRASQLGGFSDHIFPIIRGTLPDSPIAEMFSIQPTTQDTASIMYLDWVTGSTKGQINKGMTFVGAQQGLANLNFGDYTSEQITNETVALAVTGGTAAAGTLYYADGGGLRAGQVSITLSTTGANDFKLTDNGNGTLILAAAAPNGITLSAGTINYRTGTFTATIAGGTFSSNTAMATYRYDSEGSAKLPRLNVQLRKTTVETERRGLILDYSVESMQTFLATTGLDIEDLLVTGASALLNYEILRQLIHEAWMAASTLSVTTFDLTPPSAINQTEHFRTFNFTWNSLAETIENETNVGQVNWAVVDGNASAFLKSLPDNVFKSAPQAAAGAGIATKGVMFIGTMNGNIRVYKDSRLSREPGASANGNILFGWKGTNFWDAGLIFCPFYLMYTTEPLTTADFLTQRGMASRYATKLVNARLYRRIALVQTGNLG